MNGSQTRAITLMKKMSGRKCLKLFLSYIRTKRPFMKRKRKWPRLTSLGPISTKWLEN